jgi:hypothetical protein
MWRWHQLEQWLVNPRFGAEIGVFKGLTTRHLLKSFSTLHMTAVDAWSTHPHSDEPGAFCYDNIDFDAVIEEFNDNVRPYQSRLTVLRMDSVKAADMVADGSLDFVFIDADHTYSSAKADIAAWAPKVRRGGLLTGHDYNRKKFPGVVQAVDEFGLPRLGAQDTWMIGM